MVSWANFKHEFEIRYYLAQFRWNKEQEFLNLKQLDMIVMEYERRFQSLSTFASVLIPTEHHKIERFKEGLTQELKKGLITDTIKRLMSSSKCRSVEVINNPARPGSNHREVNCINYK